MISAKRFRRLVNDEVYVAGGRNSAFPPVEEQRSARWGGFCARLDTAIEQARRSDPDGASWGETFGPDLYEPIR